MSPGRIVAASRWNDVGPALVTEGTTTTYSPGMSWAKRKTPRSSVCCRRHAPPHSNVSCVSVARPPTMVLISARTVAPTIGSPDSSTTRPPIDAYFHRRMVTFVMRSLSSTSSGRD